LLLAGQVTSVLNRVGWHRLSMLVSGHPAPCKSGKSWAGYVHSNLRMVIAAAMTADFGQSVACDQMMLYLHARILPLLPVTQRTGQQRRRGNNWRREASYQ
jgi:hypothetical protein